jgi:hypothetical protein
MDWGMIITKASELATVVSCCCAVPTALVAVVVAAIQLNGIKKQFRQTNDHILITLSNQHNWNLFEHREDVPGLLPSWAQLSDTNKGWGWRILLLNHLNLLHLAYQEHSRNLMDRRDFEDWKSKARYWFQSLVAESPDPEISEGRKVLRQLLSREEAAYSDEFREWLVEAKIIPVDLLSD